jgi:hypothetical protein
VSDYSVRKQLTPEADRDMRPEARSALITAGVQSVTTDTWRRLAMSVEALRDGPGDQWEKAMATRLSWALRADRPAIGWTFEPFPRLTAIWARVCATAVRWFV